MIRCVFSFNDWWEAFPVKTAVFSNSSMRGKYEAVIVNNSCVVPHEVLELKGEIKVAVRGENSSPQIELTAPLNIAKQLETLRSGENAIEPTPDQYTEFIERADERIDEYFTKHHDDFKGFSPIANVTKQGEETTITITDESGTTEAVVKDGKNGKTPEKGVDYFTESEKAGFVSDIKNYYDPKFNAKSTELTDKVETEITKVENKATELSQAVASEIAKVEAKTTELSQAVATEIEKVDAKAEELTGTVETEIAKIDSKVENAVEGSLGDLKKTDEELSREIDVLQAVNNGNTFVESASSGEAKTVDIIGNEESVVIDKIYGKSIVVNQLVDNNYRGTSEVYGISRTKKDANTVHYQGTSTNSTSYTGTTAFSWLNSHVYYYRITGDNIPSECGVRNAYFGGSALNVKDDRTVATRDVINNSLALYIPAGTTIDADVVFECFDLTQMFGIGNEPTIEECRKLFVNSVHPYNAGEIKNASPSKVVERKRNILPNADDLLKAGGWVKNADGSYTGYVAFLYVLTSSVDTQIFRYPYAPNTQYTFSCDFEYENTGETLPFFWGVWYSDGTRSASTGYDKGHIVHTSDANKSVIGMRLSYGENRKITIKNVQIERGIVETPYEPYHETVLELPNVELRSAGSVRDELDLARGKVIRRVGVVDLGTLNWAKANYGFYSWNLQNKYEINLTKSANCTCSKYVTVDSADESNGICLRYDGATIVTDTAYSDATTFKSAMNGVLLYYELAEPYEEDIDVIGRTLPVSKGGSVTFEADIDKEGYRIPVGYEMTYQTKIGITERINGIEADIVNVDNKNVEQDKRIEELERKNDALWKLSQGQTHDFQTVDGEYYEEVIPTGCHYFEPKKLGGKSVVWNQLLPYNDFSTNITNWYFTNAVTCVVDGNEVEMTRTDADSHVNFGQVGTNTQANHRYFVYCDIKPDFILKSCNLFVNNATLESGKNIQANIWTRCSNIITPSVETPKRVLFYASDYTVTVGQKIRLKNFNVVDLTKMFGSGNEPTSTDDPRIKWIERYAEEHSQYNGGEIVSAEIDGIVERGKNLIDFDNMQILTKYTNTDGRYTNAIVTNYERCVNLPCEPNTVYTASCNVEVTGRLRMSFYDSEPTVGMISLLSRGANDKTITLTSPSNARWVSLFFWNVPSSPEDVVRNSTKLMLEKGSVAHEYVPYHEQSYDLPNIELRSAGTVHDEIDIERGVIVRRVGVVDLGTLTWTYQSNKVFRADGIDDKKIPTSASDRRNGLLSDIYTPDDAPIQAILTDLTMSGYQNTKSVYFINNSYTSASDIKQAMNGVMLHYELAEPYEEPITVPVFDLLPCEPNGSITFENSLKIPIPSNTQYVVKLSEV